MPMRTRFSAALLLSLASAGCGASLAPKFVAPIAPTEEVVAQHLETPKPRDHRAVVVGVTTDPMRLAAWDMNGKPLWEREVDAKSSPVLAGDTVVLQEADGIVVRDLATGERLRVVDDDGRLIAADGIGRSVVVSIGYAEGPTRGSVVLVEDNRERWRQSLVQPVGSAALLGDLVLVPWGTQRLTVLNAADGMEVARWAFTNVALGRAFVAGDDVFIGQHGVLRVDRTLPAHRDGPVALYSPLKRPLPAQPPLMRDGYAPVPPPDDAWHRLRVEWRPIERDGVVSAEGDLLALRFHRLVFGLDAQKDEVRFVRAFDDDIVGASVVPEGLFVVDARGNLMLLDATGAQVSSQSLGKGLRMAVVRPKLGPHAAPATAQSAVSTTQPSSLHDQLLAAARLDDTRLVPARAFAVEHLARSPEANVTAELIDMCGDRASPEGVRLSACNGIARRDTGAPDVLAALRRRASFLDGTNAPPVGALAQAAVRMKLKQAAPLLATHAEDPNTTPSDLVAVFQALDDFGYRAATPALERFVRLHHAEPQGSELSPALFAAVTALGDLRAKNARGTLTEMADDGFTQDGLRKKASEALAVLDAPPVPAKVDAPVEKAAPVAPEPAPEVEEVQTDPRPYSLDAAAVYAVFKPIQGSLVRCLEADATKPKSARVTMVVAGDGSVEGILVTPTSAQPCMAPIVQRAKFPATRLGRQHVTQTIQTEAEAEATESGPTRPPANAKPAAPAGPESPAKGVGPAKAPATARPVAPAATADDKGKKPAGTATASALPASTEKGRVPDKRASGAATPVRPALGATGKSATTERPATAVGVPSPSKGQPSGKAASGPVSAVSAPEKSASRPAASAPSAVPSAQKGAAAGKSATGAAKPAQ